MKRRDLIKVLEKAGFKFVRNHGHSIYKNNEIRVEVPNHREINEITAQRILKDAGLK